MSERLNIAVRRLANGDGLPLPAHASSLSAGVDLLAAVETEVEIAPGGRAVIPTGLAIALPEGYEAQVRPRSGLAATEGVTVLNSPGTIDADYRGEIGAVLINLGERPFRVVRGMRIAQLVVQRVVAIDWAEADELPKTTRGAGGFGSTGQGG